VSRLYKETGEEGFLVTACPTDNSYFVCGSQKGLRYVQLKKPRVSEDFLKFVKTGKKISVH